MPFNPFHKGGQKNAEPDKSSTHPSDHRDSSLDEGYFSFNENDYSDDGFSSDEEAETTQTYEYDHGKNKGFKHDNVDPSTEVRLLRITKVTKTVVEGHFKKVSVADLATTTYLALSYTWGKARTEKDVNCINIGGQTLYVRNNLWNFFISNGEQCRAKFLYVDAICINQRNMQERGHQVKLMAEIYANADLVYVWLGKPLTSQHSNLKALRWRLSNPFTRKDWDRQAMFGLGYICSLRYWTRLWIVQELLLAKNIMIVCGKWRFNFDELANLQREPLAKADLDSHKKLDWWTVWEFNRPDSYSDQDDAEVRMSSGWEFGLRILDHRSRWIRNRARARSVAGKPVGLPLYKAVSYFSKQECYDPRDKIFALIGLLRPSDKNRITPDYECKHQDVYAQALEVGLLSLQRRVEPKALAEGYYPRDQYEEYALSLRNILALTKKDVAEATMEAFKSEEFARNFYQHCRSEKGSAWPKDKSPAEIESSIYYDFLMLTKGKKSPLKVFRLRLNVQGKAHLTSAALTAARVGVFEEKTFLKENEKQGVTFGMLYAASKVWERAAHFRRWTPFGG